MPTNFLHCRVSAAPRAISTARDFDTTGAARLPLWHFQTTGWKEGRDPSVNFDTTSYLAAYHDVAAANINPLMHFLAFGQQEGRSAFAGGVWG